MPACRREVGCPIEDVAADLELNRYIEKFMRAKALHDMNEISSILETEYKEMGLLENIPLLFELEKIWAEFRSNQQSERMSKKQRSKWNRII